MATYSLFNQATPTGSNGGGGNTTSSYGLQFSVSSAAVLQKIEFYSPSGATVLPDVIGLFDTSGNLVVWVTPSWSGAAGSGWINASFSAPPSLAPSTNYTAAIHMPFSSGFWNVTDSTYWSSGAGASGITSGILSAPNNATAVHGQNSVVTGSSLEFPNTSLTGANIWMDVLVADAPANTYTIFKQQPVSAPATNDNSAYTMGMQFQVSSAFTAAAVWFFSPYFPSQSPELPESIGIYHVGTQALVHSETPTWSGSPGSGWVRAAFSSPPLLNATTDYKVVILKSGGSNNWYASASNYWSSGAGASGLTNGPVSAPNNASALNGQTGGGGQDVFNVGTGLVYPNNAFNAGNYWVDVEVTTSGSTSISVTDFAGMVEAPSVTATVAVSDVMAMRDTLAIVATVPVADFAAMLDTASNGMFFNISVTDFAGSVESPSISATIPVRDFIGMVEALSGNVTLSVSDVSAGLDTIFNSGATAVNLRLPAITFMAAAYKGAT
jgi:hypothetical protein